MYVAQAAATDTLKAAASKAAKTTTIRAAVAKFTI